MPKPDPAVYQAAVLALDPAAYYRMEETSGAIQDSSGDGNHMTTVVGSPRYQLPGQVGRGITFDGASEFSSASGRTSLADVFTMMAWIKRDFTGSSEETIFAQSTGGGGMYVLNDRLMGAQTGVGAWAWSDPFLTSTSRRYFIAITKNDATRRLYIDGAEVADTGGFTNLLCGHLTPVYYVGAEIANGSPFRGTIDEVAVFPTELTPAQIRSIYLAGGGGPVFVGAGTGAEGLIAGSFTVSKTGCTAGNLVAFDMQVNGSTGDWGGFTNRVNVQDLAGVAGQLEFETNSAEHQLAWGVVTADGTVSADLTVGASGEDIAARIYEFDGGFDGRTLPQPLANVASILENGSGVDDSASATSTSVGDVGVTTRGPNRLALNFVGIKAATAIAPFQGQSGGSWIEAIAEYVGTTLTLQLQMATMPDKGTIDGGTATITSAAWQTIGTALKPYVDPQPQGVGVHGLGWLS